MAKAYTIRDQSLNEVVTVSASSIQSIEPKHEVPLPIWHTMVVLAVLFVASAISARQHGLERIDFPGLSPRISSYVTVMGEEWLLVLFIWLGLRWRGVSVSDLISAGRNKGIQILEDWAFSLVFVVGWLIFASVVSQLLKLTPPEASRSLLPRTGTEAVVFVLLSVTAGFCEELIFRGYLQRQFTAWTGSAAAGLLIQGLAFGLSHGYHGLKFMTIITLEGCCLGLLARWRRSLRSAMFAHAMQDSLGGLLAYALRLY
ncbi:MAG TPA: CPBP family intramembrane glutamic endopeptidase [Candidatus Angelobacter sp.]|nr:CPBP family intramembrane glutamic endopeptidase [Candidatus Angelobacter sp.]